MNERIVKLITEADAYAWTIAEKYVPECGEVNYLWEDAFRKKFAELIVRECINKIETHEIPVGNSAAGEMACEWTYAALKEIRDEIKEHFGVEE